MGDAYADRVRLETRRCSIRPFVSEDRKRLAEIANDRRISRNRTAGIGYWLAPTHWGRGYATEVVAAMLEYVFETFPDMTRLVASVYGWNPGSGRVLEKCGFRKEATLRKAVAKDGELTDEHIYRLLREELGQGSRFDPSPASGVAGEETPLYESFAEDFEDHAQESAYNAYYDRPAVLELVGDVDGKRVLDVGCGPGFYAEVLVKRGGQVVGFDSSPTMVDLARRRVGDGAEFRVHDLAQPFSWLVDESFDAAVAALVIHYVDDRRQLFRELHRVLKPGGHVVVSTHHPTLDWLRTGGSYFAEGIIEERWSRGWDMRYWRMPLGVAVDEMTDAGFLIERIVEPTAVPELAEVDPEHYEELTTQPRFICFRLVKI